MNRGLKITLIAVAIVTVIILTYKYRLGRIVGVWKYKTYDGVGDLKEDFTLRFYPDHTGLWREEWTTGHPNSTYFYFKWEIKHYTFKEHALKIYDFRDPIKEKQHPGVFLAKISFESSEGWGLDEMRFIGGFDTDKKPGKEIIFQKRNLSSKELSELQESTLKFDKGVKHLFPTLSK